MGLESGTYISDLNANNPVNATDVVGEGDDHLRLIKSTLLNTFPNITGAVTASQAELNHLVGATENIQSALDGIDAAVALKADAAATTAALALKADDSLVVKLAGAQTITGQKTINANLLHLGSNFATFHSGINGNYNANGTAWGAPIWGMRAQTTDIEPGSTSFDLSTKQYGVYYARPDVVGALATVGEGVYIRTATITTAALGASGIYTAGNIELGHASDTTLSRVAAGRVAIEGGEIAKLNGTEPFTAQQRFAGTSNYPVRLEKTNAATDQKILAFEWGTNQVILLALNDAVSGSRKALRIVRDGFDIPSIELFAENIAQLLTQDNTAAPATTGAQVRHADGSLYDVGMNVMPPVIQNASLTIGREHIGKTLIHDNATAYTFTTPANTDTTVPVGSVVNIVNYGSGAITIAKGSSVNLFRYDGTGAPTNTNRTLSQGGVATLYRSSASSWNLWGNAGLN